MKINATILLLAFSTLSSALPQSDALYRESAEVDTRAPLTDDINADIFDLWKRKGGGGGGGGSGGGRGGGGTTTGGGSTGGGRGLGSSTSSTGGRTTTGSGPPPAYGSGGTRYYGGGGTSPYTSGSSRGSYTPFLFGGALGVAAFYPGYWAYGAYGYPYTHPWNFRNATTASNQTKPVQCLCEQYLECGCDDNDDATFRASLLGDGTYAGLNKSVITVADLNGTSTILLNGTLPNGTTAAGGDEDPNAAGSLVRGMMETSGHWLMLATVFCTLFLA